MASRNIDKIVNAIQRNVAENLTALREGRVLPNCNYRNLQELIERRLIELRMGTSRRLLTPLRDWPWY